jgi:hypothetical protein
LPFTISHTVVAWPVKRVLKRLPIDALIIGTMAPDIEYLFDLTVHGKYWHTLQGLVLGALPVCLVLVLLWRKAVRPAIHALLPALPRKSVDKQRLLITLTYASYAIILGGLTHILWDSFTHDDGWFVQQMPFMLTEVFKGRYLFHFAQDISSVVGLGVVLAKLWKMWKRDSALLQSIEKRRFYLLFGFVLLLSAVGGVLNAIPSLDRKVGVVVAQFLIGGMAAFCVVVAVTSMVILIVRYYHYHRKSAGDHSM